MISSRNSSHQSYIPTRYLPIYLISSEPPMNPDTSIVQKEKMPTIASKKRTLDTNFFTPTSQKQKKPRTAEPPDSDPDPKPKPELCSQELLHHSSLRQTPSSPSSTANHFHHPSYPFPITDPPATISAPKISHLAPGNPGREIRNQDADLDLLYFQPFIPAALERQVFEYLRSALFFQRVSYKIKRGGSETQVQTPRL